MKNLLAHSVRLLLIALLAGLSACSGDDGNGGADGSADGGCSGWKIATGNCATPFTCVTEQPCSAAGPTAGCGCGGKIVSVAAGCPSKAYGWTSYGLDWLADKAPGRTILCDPDKKPPAKLDVRVNVSGVAVDGKNVSVSLWQTQGTTAAGEAAAVSQGGAAAVLLAGVWPIGLAAAEVRVRVVDLPPTAQCPQGVDLAASVTVSHDFDLRDFEISVAVDASSAVATCR